MGFFCCAKGLTILIEVLIVVMKINNSFYYSYQGHHAYTATRKLKLISASNAFDRVINAVKVSISLL